MAAEVIPEKITFENLASEVQPDRLLLIETGVEVTDFDESNRPPVDRISTYVLPRLVESDLGVSRHRPAGEPGSLQGIDFRNVDERPDDN